MQTMEIFYRALAGLGKLDTMYMLYSASSSKVGTEVPADATAASLFSNVATYGGILRVTDITPAGFNTAANFIGSSDNGEAFGEAFTDGVQVYAIIMVMSGESKEQDLLFEAGQITPTTKAANAAVVVTAGVTLS